MYRDETKNRTQKLQNIINIAYKSKEIWEEDLLDEDKRQEVLGKPTYKLILSLYINYNNHLFSCGSIPANMSFKLLGKVEYGKLHHV
jgi:hypothetical protein